MRYFERVRDGAVGVPTADGARRGQRYRVAANRRIQRGWAATSSATGARTERNDSTNMMDRSEWTTADFKTLSWHDCHVYGFSLEEGEYGTCELSFDLDFIVEWQCHVDRSAEFLVAPATLTFHAVFGLRVELDYAIVSAGMCPFGLDGIEREALTSPTGYSRFRWRLPVNWPKGLITFESPGFTQVLRQPPILVPRQALRPEERLTRAASDMRAPK